MAAHVRRTSEQVYGPHGVSLRRRLLAYRQMRLRVFQVVRATSFLSSRRRFQFEIVRPSAALVDKISGQFKVLWIIGRTIQFHKGEFHFRMPRIAVLLPWIWAENARDAVREPTGDREDLLVARCRVVCGRRLDQVACAVQFMVVAQVGPARVRAGDDKVGIQIAIWSLLSCKQINNRVRFSLQVRIAFGGKNIANRLQPFV